MSPATLLPNPAELRLDHLISEPNAVTVVVQTTREAVPCPDCQHPSRRVHSHYTRTLADLPWNGIAVRLRLHTRRFFCSSLTCSRRVFTERLPGTASSPCLKSKTPGPENVLTLKSSHGDGHAKEERAAGSAVVRQRTA
jgi:transposase